MTFELKPVKAIRELDLRKIHGLEVVLVGGHCDEKTKADQYFNIKKPSELKINSLLGHDFYFQGWAGKYIGE